MTQQQHPKSALGIILSVVALIVFFLIPLFLWLLTLGAGPGPL